MHFPRMFTNASKDYILSPRNNSQITIFVYSGSVIFPVIFSCRDSVAVPCPGTSLHEWIETNNSKTIIILRWWPLTRTMSVTEDLIWPQSVFVCVSKALIALLLIFNDSAHTTELYFAISRLGKEPNKRPCIHHITIDRTLKWVILQIAFQ